MKAITQPIIGCMSWGKWGKNLSTNDQAEFINQVLEMGLNTFDHADIYGAYTTEESFGNALKQSGVNRSQIKLISKCGIQLKGEPRNNYVKHYNYRKEYIISSAERSINKLRASYLDVFLLHRPSPLMQADEIAEAIAVLKDKGLIKSFGVSNFSPHQMEMIQSAIKIDVNQIECSLLETAPLTNGTLDFHQTQHIQTMAWSPLGNYYGLKNEQKSSIGAVMYELTEKYASSVDMILLAWLTKHPANIVPVIGTTQLNRIKAAQKAMDLNLDDEDWFLLYEASLGHPIP